MRLNLPRFQEEMAYNPRMFLWKNSTDIDYISDVTKIIDQGLFVLLLTFLALVVIYVCRSINQKEYQYANSKVLDESVIMYGIMVNVIVTCKTLPYFQPSSDSSSIAYRSISPRQR